MQNSVILCNSKHPIPEIFASKPEAPSEFSTKPTISLTKKPKEMALQQPHKITDLHLNHLCRNRQLKEAVIALDSIVESGSKVRPKTYISLVQSCIDSDSIEQGRELHARIGSVRNSTPFVETKLISMYAKCGSLEEAREVFGKMHERNLFAWSAMIAGYAREQRWEDIVLLFVSMMEEGIIPDEFLLPKILQACANSGDLKTGKAIHSLVLRSRLYSTVHVNNSVLAMYAKCKELSSARRLFEKMLVKDLVTWNSIVSGYCQDGNNEEALRLFNRMQVEGIKPGLVTWNILITSYNQSGNCDLAMELMKKMENSSIVPDVFTWTSVISGFDQNNRKSQALDLFREMRLAGVEPNSVTIASALSACSSLKALKKGMEIHSVAVKIGSSSDVLVDNSLIDMYAKCGKLDTARKVFDKVSEKDVFTWNSMIGGYAQAGYCGKAYDLFSKMHESGVRQNAISWNVMITGYMQNGDEDQAMELFHRMETEGIQRNTASWNSLIAGSLQNGHRDKALGIFRQMQSVCTRPNSVTVLTVLPACANIMLAVKVKEIHSCVLRGGLESEVSIANCLIDTYSKSGNIISARSIFDSLPSKDLISWNSLIAGYVLHGHYETALEVFNLMKWVGIKPNQSTFASMIPVYGLAGMIDEGKELFSAMMKEYQISPGLEHYAAMVDLLGRSGRLKEAASFIENMPIKPDSTVWTALLRAGRINRNIKLVTYAAEHLVELEPGNSLIHRLLLQIYAVGGKSKVMSRMRKPKKRNGTVDSHGCSWTEVKNTVHNFSTGDRSMPDSESIYAQLDRMAEEIKVAGSDFPDNTQLYIEEEEREDIVGIHSEKLAIVFALIASPATRNIRIVKSLRMCMDCHRVAKIISTLYGCEIFLKDPNCLHHFKNGLCSCRDYW